RLDAQDDHGVSTDLLSTRLVTDPLSPRLTASPFGSNCHAFGSSVCLISNDHSLSTRLVTFVAFGSSMCLISNYRASWLTGTRRMPRASQRGTYSRRRRAVNG